MGWSAWMQSKVGGAPGSIRTVLARAPLVTLARSRSGYTAKPSSSSAYGYFGVEEALDGIDRDTEADAHSLLCFGDDAATASAELENDFAGLQSGQLKSSLCIRTMAGINIGRAAHHVCKVVIGVGKRTRVHHGDDIGERALREIS
jgi:hypothetical protein